jgi:hypothetical protein
MATSGANVYWTEAANAYVSRANLDGSGPQILVKEPRTRSIQGISLDVGGGKMYWIDNGVGANGNILRANLDAIGEQIVLTSTLGTFHPRGLALDVSRGKMYWTDDGNSIGQANLDGTLPKPILQRGLSSPQGIALDVVGGKMYWALAAVLLTGISSEPTSTAPAQRFWSKASILLLASPLTSQTA